MQGHHVTGAEVLKASEWVVGHVAAIVVGFVLMILGVALSVTMVLLPIGLPVGLFGLFVFLWGFLGAGAARAQKATEPPTTRATITE